MSRSSAAQRLRSHPGAVVTMLGSVLAASAFAFATPATAGTVSADDSRATPTNGNITSCPNDDPLVVGGTSSTTQNGITVTVTTLSAAIPNPFPAGGHTTIPKGKQVLTVTLPSGSTLTGTIYVKGAPGYNIYPGSDLTSLIPPQNSGGNIAGLSHYLICGSLDGTQPTPTPTQTITITPTPTPTTPTPTPTSTCPTPERQVAAAVTTVDDECPTPTPTPTPTCPVEVRDITANVSVDDECPTPTPTTPTPTPTTPTPTPTTPTPTPTQTIITTPTPTPTQSPQFGQLHIHKSVDKHAANYGDNLVYTLRVAATGAVDEHNVVVTDVVPDKTTFVSATCDAPCTVSGPSGGVVTWTIGTLSVGDTVDLHMTVNIDKPSGDTAPKEIITNSAVASSTEHPEVPSNPVKTHVNQVLGEKVTRHHHHHHVTHRHVKAVHHKQNQNPPATSPSGSTLPFTGMPASSLGRFALVLVALGLVLEVVSRFRRTPARKRLH